ncbi:hypothetical protein L9F63_011224, partial [Diploptera punctata]
KPTCKLLNLIIVYFCNMSVGELILIYILYVGYVSCNFMSLIALSVGLIFSLLMFVVLNPINVNWAADFFNFDHRRVGNQSLRVLLSFAVGCLLGDVFLHLLPEVWGQNIELDAETGHPSMNKGLWVLAGLLIFIILEKVFSSIPENVDIQIPKTEINTKSSNGYIHNNNVKEACNGYANGHIPAKNNKQSSLEDETSPVKHSTIKYQEQYE